MSLATLWDILDTSRSNFKSTKGITIPMIQRDYAQGRKNEKAEEIRIEFLKDIKDAIVNVHSISDKPLELDFIYGYIENETFIPLDGQQRLTTLFLIHWYFVYKDNKLEDYKSILSRFTYQTRHSSEEFLKKMICGLSEEDNLEIFQKNKSFKQVIENKNWYFVNWQHDPTIQSIMVMLDAIHHEFKTVLVIFEELIDLKKPSLVFHFLDINQFGLSDALYIKMNARGKPLTEFENLKAELGRYIEKSDFNLNYNFSLQSINRKEYVDLKTYFITKIDTNWSDYFWNKRNSEDNSFDDKLTNLLVCIALNQQAIDDTVLLDKSFKVLKNTNTMSYYRFQTLSLLNEKSILNYIRAMDFLTSNDHVIQTFIKSTNKIDIPDLLSKIFKEKESVTYADRIFAHGLFAFINVVERANDQEKELDRWKRLLFNLVTNTIHNNHNDFRNSIVGIDELISGYKGDVFERILTYKITGFDTTQSNEEHIKIALIKLDSDWERLIFEIEDHPYLRGQITPVLVYSSIWEKYFDSGLNLNASENELFKKEFEKYSKLFQEIFCKDGLKNELNKLFRKALLSFGDYLVYSSNWSFVENGFHRDKSWKRFLKETGNRKDNYWIKKTSLMKEVLDCISLSDVKGSLLNTINMSSATDWRKDFVENPVLWEQMGQYHIKFIEHNLYNNIYVLRNSKFNKELDPEIKSLILREKLVLKGISKNEIHMCHIEAYNQYGISQIKNKKLKIVYNHDYQGKYLLKQNDIDEVVFDTEDELINVIMTLNEN